MCSRLILLSFILALSTAEVVVLTAENFHDVVSQNEVGVVVEFYAPWCGHCKSLAPEYEKAASSLKDAGSLAVLANCDATIETELAQKYGVSGYPTLKFFKGDVENAVDFQSGRTAEEIVVEVQKLTDPNYKPPPSAVVVLTADSFPDFVNNNEISLVEFYAPWCGHCKKLAPEFEVAAAALKKENIFLANVDATVESNLASDYGVTGYPTLKLFRKGKVFDLEKNLRSAESIIQEMRRQAAPSSTRVSSVRDLKNAININKETILGYFDSENSDIFRVYMESSQQARDEYIFYHTFDPDVANALKIELNPQIALFISPRYQSKYEPKYKALNQASSVAEVLDFYASASIPLVGEYTPERYSTKRPLIVIFYLVDFQEHKENTQYWRNKFVEIARKNPAFTFAVADEARNMDMLKSVGLDLSSEDFNVVIYDEDDLRYPLEPADEFGIDVLVDFIKKYNDGNLKPYFKSQKAPKKQSSSVITVVASTFKEVVLDESKDVFIELYAPWCGHCKRLEPIYKEFADTFKDDKDLRIAKMDSTVNDMLPKFKASGFPTIFFVPKGSKDPISFEGARTVEGFKDFLDKQRSGNVETEDPSVQPLAKDEL